MHDFSCSGAESVVSLSYFSPAQPAGPTMHNYCGCVKYAVYNVGYRQRWQERIGVQEGDEGISLCVFFSFFTFYTAHFGV